MTYTLTGPFRLGPSTAEALEELPAEPSESFQTQKLSMAWGLLRAAAADQVLQTAESSEAWIAHYRPERSQAAQAWAAYARRFEAFGESTPDLETFQALLLSVPASGSRDLRELAALLGESDPELFAEALLLMGGRHLNSRPQFAFSALQAASQFPTTSSRARRLLDAAGGRGSMGDQFEVQAPRLLRELSSPLLLASFGSGVLLSRVASLATLSRFGRFGWGSLVASEGAALAVEVPAMVFTRRLGERLFHGGASLLAADQIGQDLLASYGPFALLRFGGNALNLGGPWLRQQLALEGQMGRQVFSGLRFGTELSSLMLGHRMNAALGLEPEVSGSQALYQGLLSLGHMRIAGRMVEGLGIGSLGPHWEAQRHQLLQRSREGIFPDFGGGLQPAFAGLPARAAIRNHVPEKFGPEILLMSSEGEGSGAGGGNSGNTPRHVPNRRALILQLFSQNFEEYSLAAENGDTFLGRLAKRLHEVLEQPEQIQDQSFARALAEMESELEAVAEHRNVAKRYYAQLKVLMGRSGEDTALPPVVEQQVENIGKDEAARGKLATSLGRMADIFKQARQFGWTEDLHAQLAARVARLNKLYRNSSWNVPGLERLLHRNEPAALLQRRQGAILGLAVLNGIETQTVRSLRDPNAPPSSDVDMELELIHQSMLAAARRSWEPAALDSEVLSLASRFGATEESAAAMLLSAATVRRLVEAGPKSTGLVDWMSTRDEANYFADRLLQLKAIQTVGTVPGAGLRQLAVDAHAADYLFSGLRLFLQSNGDPARLNQGLESARAAKVRGFHPSIAASLFGATHGRKNLPDRLWSADLDPDAFLKRALEPDIP